MPQPCCGRLLPLFSRRSSGGPTETGDTVAEITHLSRTMLPHRRGASDRSSAEPSVISDGTSTPHANPAPESKASPGHGSRRRSPVARSPSRGPARPADPALPQRRPPCIGSPSGAHPRSPWPSLVGPGHRIPEHRPRAPAGGQISPDAAPPPLMDEPLCGTLDGDVSAPFGTGDPARVSRLA
jgi:hypothetical protein